MRMQWFRLIWGRLIGRRAIEIEAAPVLEAQAMQHVGAGNVQVAGSVGGMVRVTHETHMHFYAAPPVHHPANDAASTPRLSTEQREVLTLMQQLARRDYHQVLAFMRREFDTGLVHQLGPQQLYRVRRYVETIQRNEEKERA